MKPAQPSVNARRGLACGWAIPETSPVPVRRGLRLPRGTHACVAGPRWGRVRRFAMSATLLLAAIVLLAGCSTPAVRQLRLVSKPTMTFEDSAIFAYHASKHVGQMERGYAGAGDAANAGCTSCK
jgi:hypothetical protein